MHQLLVIFGNTIRRVRKQKGMSQEELADLCNLHRTYLGGIERGERNVCLLNILHIANALGIPPSELFQDFGAEVMAHLPEKHQ